MSPRKSSEQTRGDRCLNCGLAITTAYCPDCGQHNANHNHGLWQFINEFFEEFFHYDSKLFRTLGPLLTRPGFLTQEWVAGRRVRYIAPLKLYVTLSALCFLAFSVRSHFFGPSDLKVDLNKPAFNISVGEEKLSPVANSKDTAVEAMIRRKLGGADSTRMIELKNKFIAQLPTTNFLLMPLIAAVFWLLYVRKRRFYVEHLVFTLHYYSFGFLVMGVASLIPLKFFTILGFIAMFVYLPIALMKNYRQSFFKTAIKLVLFGAIYGILLLMALFWTLMYSAIQLPDVPAAVQSLLKH